MTPRSKKTESCNPTNNLLCPEIIELRVIVKNIGESVIDMQHLILGNGKDGMKTDLSKQSDAIGVLDKKMDLVLAEQKIISDERIARAAKEKEQAKQRAEEKSNRRWTFRWILGLAFDKFTAPIIVAIVLYLMLGGK